MKQHDINCDIYGNPKCSCGFNGFKAVTTMSVESLEVAVYAKLLPMMEAHRAELDISINAPITIDNLVRWYSKNIATAIHAKLYPNTFDSDCPGW